jgi:hypothetical protein
MNPDPFFIPAEFWLNRELSKVPDLKRRAFLRKLFAGKEGYQKFIWLMIRRRGAVEFKNGTWAKKLPKYNRTELRQKMYRPCSGNCGNLVRKIKSPWGEIIEDEKPICETCKKDIYDYVTRKNRIVRKPE